MKKKEKEDLYTPLPNVTRRRLARNGQRMMLRFVLVRYYRKRPRVDPLELNVIFFAGSFHRTGW